MAHICQDVAKNMIALCEIGIFIILTHVFQRKNFKQMSKKKWKICIKYSVHVTHFSREEEFLLPFCEVRGKNWKKNPEQKSLLKKRLTRAFWANFCTLHFTHNFWQLIYLSEWTNGVKDCVWMEWISYGRTLKKYICGNFTKNCDITLKCRQKIQEILTW